MKRTFTKLLFLALGLGASLSLVPASQAQLYFLCVDSYCSTRPASHPCWCGDTLTTCGQRTGCPVEP